MSKLVAAAVAAVLLLTANTAEAHTDEQLDDWTLSWGRRVIPYGLTDTLAAEYEDWASRHPRYFGRPIPHTHPQRSRTYSAGVEQWRSLVATYFRPADVDRALRIMACESNGNPLAANPNSSARGLLQHLERYWPARSAAAGWTGASIYNPEANIAVGAWLRDQPGGWLHWRACQ